MKIISASYIPLCKPSVESQSPIRKLIKITGPVKYKSLSKISINGRTQLRKDILHYLITRLRKSILH